MSKEKLVKYFFEPVDIKIVENSLKELEKEYELKEDLNKKWLLNVPLHYYKDFESFLFKEDDYGKDLEQEYIEKRKNTLIVLTNLFQEWIEELEKKYKKQPREFLNFIKLYIVDYSLKDRW